MATAATALSTDPFDAWISSLPRDVRDVVIERVILNSGRRGGRRKDAHHVDVAALRAAAYDLRDGRYRITAYGSRGAARGGVCAVDVRAGVVALAAARASSGRRAPRAANASAPRRSNTDAELVARVEASEVEVTTVRRELAALGEELGAKVARLEREVRRWKRAAKRAALQPPTTPPPSPSVTATQVHPSAPTPDRFDLGRIVGPRFTPLAPNPAPHARPTQHAPTTPDASPLAAFLRGTTSSTHGASPWLDLTPVLRFLQTLGMIPGVAAPAVRNVAPSASTRSGVLRAYLRSAHSSPANEAEWAASAASALVPAAHGSALPAALTVSATMTPPARDTIPVGDDEREAVSDDCTERDTQLVDDAQVDDLAVPNATASSATAPAERLAADFDDVAAVDPPMPVPPPWIDRSPSHEFVPTPDLLVPRSLGRRLERLARSVAPSAARTAIERVYTEALTLGLESLGAELEIVHPTNDDGPAATLATRRPAARSFTRLPRMHVPARLVRALRVVTAAGVEDVTRFPNAVAVHAEALRRGVELLEQHPALIETEQDDHPSRRRPIDVAAAIDAQMRGRCQCDA